MEDLLNLFLILFGALPTFYLSSLKHIGPIRASALVTLLGVFIFGFFPSTFSEYRDVLIFGGSFIGMSGVERISKYFLPLGCIFFYGYFMAIAPHIKGFGGALGLGAFLSVVPLALINLVYKKRIN